MSDPKQKRGNQIITLLPEEQLSFDVEAFDELIRSQGVTMVHYRAMRCPIGLTDKYDIRHPDNEEHDGCSNGFIYMKAGEVTGYFQNNAHKPNVITEGLLESAVVGFTLPRNYDNCEEPIIVVPFDRFFLKDCEAKVATWETIAASQTGVDRLQYPALEVEHIVDSKGIAYQEGKDFRIVDGKISWIGGEKQPGFDPKLGKPVIYTIRYRYQPHWYIKELVHEIRVAQITDQATFDRKVERLPYMAILQREYAFLSDQRSRNNDNPRDSRSPDDGGNLGPR